MFRLVQRVLPVVPRVAALGHRRAISSSVAACYRIASLGTPLRYPLLTYSVTSPSTIHIRSSAALYSTHTANDSANRNGNINDNSQHPSSTQEQHVVEQQQQPQLEEEQGYVVQPLQYYLTDDIGALPFGHVPDNRSDSNANRQADGTFDNEDAEYEYDRVAVVGAPLLHYAEHLDLDRFRQTFDQLSNNSSNNINNSSSSGNDSNGSEAVNQQYSLDGSICSSLLWVLLDGNCYHPQVIQLFVRLCLAREHRLDSSTLSKFVATMFTSAADSQLIDRHVADESLSNKQQPTEPTKATKSTSTKRPLFEYDDRANDDSDIANGALDQETQVRIAQGMSLMCDMHDKQWIDLCDLSWLKQVMSHICSSNRAAMAWPLLEALNKLDDKYKQHRQHDFDNQIVVQVLQSTGSYSRASFKRLTTRARAYLQSVGKDVDQQTLEAIGELEAMATTFASASEILV
jgi:hypothetical protein